MPLKINKEQRKEKKHPKRIPKYSNASGINSDLIFSDCLASEFELRTNNAGAVSISEVCLLYILIKFAHFIKLEEAAPAIS